VADRAPCDRELFWRISGLTPPGPEIPGRDGEHCSTCVIRRKAAAAFDLATFDRINKAVNALSRQAAAAAPDT
jgi:hypothetical protein